MKSPGITTTAILLLASICLHADDATAQQGSNQFGSSPRRPTTSPYLNLIGGGRGGRTAFNYFQRVRPELEFRRNDTRFDRSLGDVRQDLSSFKRQVQSRQSDLSSTGHRTSFFNLRGYFGSNSSR